MRYGKRIIIVMMVFLFLFSMIPISSTAASYRVKTLKLNSWYKLKESSSKMPIYKLELKSDSVIIVTWKNLNPDGRVRGYFYLDKNCNDYICEFVV